MEQIQQPFHFVGHPSSQVWSLASHWCDDVSNCTKASLLIIILQRKISSQLDQRRKIYNWNISEIIRCLIMLMKVSVTRSERCCIYGLAPAWLINCGASKRTRHYKSDHVM